MDTIRRRKISVVQCDLILAISDKCEKVVQFSKAKDIRQYLNPVNKLFVNKKECACFTQLGWTGGLQGSVIVQADDCKSVPTIDKN